MLKPVALLGGERQCEKPWRNTLGTFAQLTGWENFLENYGQLELAEYLKSSLSRTYQSMLQLQKNALLASSAGRLFDAVAGAIGLCRGISIFRRVKQQCSFKVLAEEAILNSESDGCGYPFKIGIWPSNGLPYLDPLPMWQLY